MKGRSVDMERLPEPPVQQASARLVCRSAGRGPLIVGGSSESPAGGETSGEVATARPSKTATRRGLLGLGLAFGVVGKAGGQSPAPRFPNQPVRVLVPYP